MVPRRNRRELHQGAGLGGHRHPPARRVRNRLHRQPVVEPERSRSFDAAIEQALVGGRGLIEATVFFNHYDDLIIATGSFSGSSQYRTDNISNARARGCELAATGRAPLSGVRGGSLQVRVAYTRLATEILAVDDNGSAPPPFTVGDRLLRRPDHGFSANVLLTAGSIAAFFEGGGRSAARDVDPAVAPGRPRSRARRRSP